MLVIGEGGTGKTTLANQVRGDAILNVDFLLSPLVSTGRHRYPAAQRRYDESKRDHDGSIRRAWDALEGDEEMRRSASMSSRRP